MSDASNSFTYYRYGSPQEYLGGNNNDQIFNYVGNTVTASAFNTSIPGTNACGGTASPGVVARSVGAAPNALGTATPTKIRLGGTYPNPASEKVTFVYFLPFESPPAELVLRNTMGQQVAVQLLPHTGAGEVHFAVSTLPAGLYMGTVEVAGQVKAGHKITIVR